MFALSSTVHSSWSSQALIPKPYLLALKLAVSAGLIALLVYWVDWQQAVKVIEGASPMWLVSSGLLILLVIVLDGLRFHWMVPVDGLHFAGHLRLALQSIFVMQLGFGVISGDAYRTAAYALHSREVFKPAAHVIAARIAGIASMGIVALVASLWALQSSDANVQNLGATIVKVVLTGVFLATLIFTAYIVTVKMRNTTIPDWCVTAVNALKSITPRVWALSVTMVVVSGSGFACVLYAIDQMVPLHIPFLASIAATLTTLLPIAFGGLGVREGALAGTVAIFGVPFTNAVSAAIIMRLVTVIVSSLGLLFSLAIQSEPSR